MKAITLFLILVIVSGCSTVSALNRLQNLSLERDKQQAEVKEQEEKFQHLLSDFSSGAIEKGASKDNIIETYGEPITEKKIDEGFAYTEELMYRHPAQFFGSEKIFLYFDSSAKLIDIKHEAPSLAN